LEQQWSEPAFRATEQQHSVESEQQHRLPAGAFLSLAVRCIQSMLQAKHAYAKHKTTAEPTALRQKGIASLQI
jgi:hypothetical protein